MAESTKALQAFLFAQELGRRFPNAIKEIEEILRKEPADHATPSSMRVVASLLGFQRDLIERFNIFLPKGISLQIWQNPDQVSVILLVNHEEDSMYNLGYLSGEVLIQEGCSSSNKKSIAARSIISPDATEHPKRNTVLCQRQNATTDLTSQIDTTEVTLLNKNLMVVSDTGMEDCQVASRTTNTLAAELQQKPSQFPVSGKKLSHTSIDVQEGEQQWTSPREFQHQSKILAEVNVETITESICDDKSTGPGILAFTPAMQCDEVCVATTSPVQIMQRHKGRGRPRKESLAIVSATNATEFLEQLGTKELVAILRHFKSRPPKRLGCVEAILLQVKETLKVKDDTRIQNLPDFVLNYRYDVLGEDGKNATPKNAASVQKRKSDHLVSSPSSRKSKTAGAKRVAKKHKTSVVIQNVNQGHADKVLSTPQLPHSTNQIDDGPLTKKN